MIPIGFYAALNEVTVELATGNSRQGDSKQLWLS